ncbi:MAG: Hpt domain-containing protein [Acidobacteriota bacterium]
MASVLLVHGDPHTREALTQALAAMGIQSTAFADAQAGWTAALQDAFDLIIWDVEQRAIEGEPLPGLLAAAGQSGPVWAVADARQAAEAECGEWAERAPHGADQGFAVSLVWQGHIDDVWRQSLAAVLPQADAASRWEGLTFDAIPGFERLLQRYRQRLPGQLDSILAAWTQGDRASVQHLAHALKGTAECFGLPQVSQLAAKIEHTVMQGEEGEVAPWIAQLEAVVREAVGMAPAAGEST